MQGFEKGRNRPERTLNRLPDGEMAGLLLAAGASSRMGCPKQLLTLGETTLLERVLWQCLESDLDHVVLVLGHHAHEIRNSLTEHLDHPRLRVVENPEYRLGISSSIQAGLSEVEERYAHVMIVLADMPEITSGLINHLRHGYLDSGMSMGAVGIQGRRSHPVIFSRTWYADLHRLKGDVGARELFIKHGRETCLVETPFAYRGIDIDTPEDLKTLQGVRPSLPGES